MSERRLFPGILQGDAGNRIDQSTDGVLSVLSKRIAPRCFISDEQKRYALDMAKQQLVKGVQGMLRNALGFSSTNRRELSGGMLSVSMEFKPGRIPTPHKPDEDILRRDVTCPECGLIHSVFGFAAWCPDCGRDLFTTHIGSEIAVVRAMLSDIDRRSQGAG